MTRIGPILAAAVTLFVTADAFACSCAFNCDDKIAVGSIVPQNVKSIGFMPCPGTRIDGGGEDAPEEVLADDEPIDLPENAESGGDPGPIKLERKTGAGWQTVKHKVYEADVPSVGPVKPWKSGEYYRLTVGKTKRGFSIKRPLRSGEVTVSVTVSDPVVEKVAYAGSPACRRMLLATRYNASLEFDKASAPYRQLFVVTQKLDGAPFRHRPSNCSMRKATHVLPAREYIIPLKCPTSPDETAIESAKLSYDVALPGLDIPIGVETPAPLVSKCDEPEPEPDVEPDAEPEEPPVETTEAVDIVPEPDLAPVAPVAPDGSTTVSADTSDDEEDSNTMSMVVVGLGLFLIISMVVGWKFSTDS